MIVTSLTPQEAGRALTAQFPRVGVHIEQSETDEGAPALIITFDDDKTEQDALTALAAYADGGAVLARAKAADLALLDQRRQAAILAWTYNNAPLPITPEFQTHVSAAVLALARQPDGTTIDWQIAPGVWTALDLAQIDAIGDAAFVFVKACYANARSLSDRIVAAADTNALGSIDLDSGWPG